MQNRREFFASIAGFVKKEEKKELFSPRPPFFELKKSSLCRECQNGACVTSCEERIIERDKDGVPFLNFSSRGCTFCKSCATSCDKGVFSAEFNKKIEAKICIDETLCMAWHDTVCKSCFDPCFEKAIEFLGLFYPSIDPKKCTACGFCVGVCPSGAIVVKKG